MAFWAFIRRFLHFFTSIIDRNRLVLLIVDDGGDLPTHLMFGIPKIILEHVLFDNQLFKSQIKFSASFIL